MYILATTGTSTTSTTYELMIDEELVCTLEDIITAISCYLASYYVFHLSYDSCITKTLEFYQLAILDITDNCPVDKSVVTLVNRLNKQCAGK